MVLSVTKHMVSATSSQLAVVAAEEASEDASRPLAYLIPPREAFNIVLYECHINYHLFSLLLVSLHITFVITQVAIFTDDLRTSVGGSLTHMTQLLHSWRPS